MNEKIISAIQQSNTEQLAIYLEEIRQIPHQIYNQGEEYTSNEPSKIAKDGAERLMNGFFAFNLSSQADLIGVTVWGTPLPRPSREGIVAYNIEAIPNDQQVVRRLADTGIENNQWKVVPPQDEDALRRYLFNRKLQGLGPPSRMFYNQPNKGEKVTLDDVDEHYFIPSEQARLRIIVDHTAGPLWDGEWAYHYYPAQEAQPGDQHMSYKESHTRFEELGLAHVTLLDWLAILKQKVTNKIEPLQEPFGYRGLFAYPPSKNSKAQSHS